ncbi:hypothetical protein [Psychroflexus aestuariivivens]|nr:hypothetical protein [Psychroflexus aestuariivivens]
MKKVSFPFVLFFILIFMIACEPEPCTKTIETMNGPETYEVDCDFAD